jgi:membrane protease YdiL (CAAX protease family)
VNPAPSPESSGLSADTIRVIVRITLFTLAGWLVWRLLPLAMPPEISGLVVAALSSFAAGAIANGLLVRMYENSRLSAFGMAWTKPSGKELLIGVAGGAGAALAIFLIALGTRMAGEEHVPASSMWPVNLLFVLLVLAFGAVGEELLFRGYAFQLLVRTMGEFAAVLPVSVLFGIAHMGNRGVTPLAILNTIVWGVLLGYAFLRTRALWLPIGLHFGWNAAMPVLGVNLSGFTMGVPGSALVSYELHWNASEIWSGGAYGFEGSVMTTMAVLVLFFVIQRAIPQTDDDPGTADAL